MLRETLYARLQGCVKKKEDVTRTRDVHLSLLSNGLASVSALGGYLIRAFTAPTSTLLEANLVFCSILKPCTFAWNAIILAHTAFGEDHGALELYLQMIDSGSQPNNATFSWVLKTCGGVRALLEGKALHQQIIEDGSEKNVIVGNSLVDMYAKCGRLDESRHVFDKIPGKTEVSWGAMISGYAQHGEGEIALALFSKMLLCQRDVKPNAFIYSCLLKGCSNALLIEEGNLIHESVVFSRFDAHEVVGGSIVDMYAKCGSLEDAHKAFRAFPHKNVVLWGALMTGFVDHGHSLHALHLFSEMQEKGIQPSRATFLCALKACSDVGVFDIGMLLHDHILRMDFHYELTIGALLIEMYAKCGQLTEARRVFDGLPPNPVAWGTLIAGYAHVNNHRSCEQCLETMQQEGVSPNDLTYSSLLSSNSHAGAHEEGCLSFKNMLETREITPSIEHYNCVVDFLGRSGFLVESEILLQTMPFLPDFVGVTALLANCHSYGNATLARGLFSHIPGL